MDNPRFPHILSVKRANRNQFNEPLTDEEGNVAYDILPLQVVKFINDSPLRDKEGRFVTDEVNEIPFGYRTASENTRQRGAVMVSDYKIACPMFITELRAGDMLEITDYLKSYKGVVVKQTTFNLGTNIWFNEVKN